MATSLMQHTVGKRATKKGKKTATIVAILAAIAALLAAIYHVIYIYEKTLPMALVIYQNAEHPKPGDQWLNENTEPIDVEAVSAEPWVGEIWVEEKGRAKFEAKLDSREHESLRLDFKGLPNGPIKILLTAEGKHTFKGTAYCKEHGGEISEDGEVTIILLGDNTIRVIVPTIGIAFDKIFRKLGHDRKELAVSDETGRIATQSLGQ